ncbi:hypothetical protein DEO23_15075 [Brachybacterium endophyticum]|uniref:SseB protein N-terminal domain-containing protein n=1 Tax=Brachybacterium endophyticum TaxID=2182385 RepID=A0A2U2RGY3_9MICO|nr:SseB family protein [Brachybacterium endophyticum]PWH05114.1 hypothetical protein DEO23_15075 [Brachybacterium endophyticum]
MTGDPQDPAKRTGAEHGDLPPDPGSTVGGRTLPAHFREKSRYTDTAGTSWAGRDYTTSPFPQDDGTTPARVADALAELASGRDPYRRGLVAALAASRLLVPIMAVATEEGVTAHGLTGDNGADMAMVSITAADGTRILPVFTAVAHLQRWQPRARPVPTPTAQAAQAAVQEGITQLVLDPPGEGGQAASAPTPITLQRSVLWALAQRRPWIPPHEDPELAAELAAIGDELPPVIALQARPGEHAEVDLLVRLREGLDAGAVQAVVGRLSEMLGASSLVADRISSLKLTLGR